MIEREITVINTLGIHARPASLIVKTAGNFHSNIWIEKDGTTADAKSILSVLMLVCAYNTKVVVRANGDDENDALAAMEKLFKDKFNEE